MEIAPVLAFCLHVRTKKTTKGKTASIINDNTSKSSNIYYNEIYCYLIQRIKQKVIINICEKYEFTLCKQKDRVL